jgi:hypothetical protein
VDVLIPHGAYVDDAMGGAFAASFTGIEGMRSSEPRPINEGEVPTMTVIDKTTTGVSPLDMPAAEKARRWAEERLDLLKAVTERRLIERASQNGHAEIGEPTVGPYVAFDVICTSPIQFIGLPPYAPGKIIAGGEDAFIVAFLFVNPTVDVANGFAVPPTTQLANRNFRVKLEELNISDATVGTNVSTPLQTGTFGAPAATLSAFVFRLSPADPGPNPKLFEANVVVDIDGAVQPYAAFATNFFDVDRDLAFPFVPPVPQTDPGFRHGDVNRYLVYSK